MLGHIFGSQKIQIIPFDNIDTFRVNGFFKFFDLGILQRALGFTHTLEDKGVFRGEEGTSRACDREYDVVT